MAALQGLKAVSNVKKGKKHADAAGKAVNQLAHGDCRAAANVGLEFGTQVAISKGSTKVIEKAGAKLTEKGLQKAAAGSVVRAGACSSMGAAASAAAGPVGLACGAATFAAEAVLPEKTAKVGGFAASVGVGAACGSVVPGLGTAVGAGVGAGSWAVGEACGVISGSVSSMFWSSSCKKCKGTLNGKRVCTREGCSMQGKKQ